VIFDLDMATMLVGAALVAVGVVAGFINTIAGGGSLLTIPALLLAGLPADLANATNRVSVVAQSLAGAQGFDQAGKLDRRAAGWLILPTMLGADGGAGVATTISAETLEPILLAVLVAVAVLMVWRPSMLSPPKDQTPLSLSQRPLAWLALFAVGFYGGFVQAGVGILLLAVLGGALRYDLVRANALKLLAVLLFTAVSLAIFIVDGKVVWLPAVVLAVGTVIGARLGVRFAIETRAETLRKAVLALVVLACAATVLR
jgi:uncharacterized protein